MKSDTRNVTPISKDRPYSFETPNRYILEASERCDSDSTEGRKILYETVVVATPVLASARIHELQQEEQKNCRFLDRSQVDELNAMLHSLYISTPTTTTTPSSSGSSGESAACSLEENEVASTDDHESTVKNAPVEEEVQHKHELSRRTVSWYSRKAKAHVTVTRSIRVAVA
jgi:hypothetical protein